MKLEDSGYNDRIEKLRIDNNLKEFEIGRVISERKVTIYCQDRKRRA
jgi:ribosome biogenesis GTPase